MQKEHKLRIEVGYGLEGTVTDAFSSRVIRNVLVPAMRAGKVEAGLSQAFDLLMRQAAGEDVATPEAAAPTSGGRSSSPFGLLVILLIAAPILIPILIAMGRGGGGRGGGGGFGGGSGSGYRRGGFYGGGWVGLAASVVAVVSAGAAVSAAAAGGGFGGGGRRLRRWRVVRAMVSSLLSEADAREVEAAVARVERGSAAELVVAVLPRSADHWQGRLLVSIAWALAGAFAVLEFAPQKASVWALLVELAVGAASFCALGWAPLQRWLVSPAAAERAAHARAFQLFAERGLYGTQGRTALLIFVSELERRVVLLGDATIHAQLGQAGWDAEVQRLISRIRERRLRDGLLEVLTDLEPRLAVAAPRQPGDVNELPDAVLRG